jgi:hypothetical protein
VQTQYNDTMAETTFNLGDLFEQTFGYKTQAFDPEFAPVSGDQALTRTEQGASGSPYYSKDIVTGVEYFMPVTLTYPDNTPLSAQDAGLVSNSAPGGLTTWNLPFPVISISSRKTIIETPLTERRGTVKELINIEDYEITIKGFIISATNDFPESDVMTLRTIYEQNTPLSIKCPLTDIFLIRPDRSGSDQVVIRELKLSPVTGVKNIRPYELSLVSDEAFSLYALNS